VDIMKFGRIIVAAILLGAAGYAGYAYYTHEPAAPAEARAGRGRGRHRGGSDTPVPVLAATAATADVPIYLDALGTVQAFNTVNVKVMVDGPLTEVRFREGQDVHAGDVLALIDSRTYQATYDQAVAKKAQDEALLANARLDLVRYQKLVATNYTSGQTSDTQRALVAQDEAQVRQDQAQIDTARTNLSYTTVTAPLNGRTGIRQVDQGNIVHASDTTPLVVITQLRPISVVFTLAQQSLPAVAAAMQAAAPEVLALAQGGNGAVVDRGQVAVLDNTVDQSTGTIKLKATFPNEALTLWPGGFVNVRLLVQTEHGVTTVPPVAVQRGPQGAYVYLLNSDDTVTRKPVEVGHEDEQTSIVTAGLEPGERVIVDGASRLTDGAKVTVASATEPTADAPPHQRHRRERASAAP
jgi:multidrug efflux system membrane fusion protein